jgi:membrane-associated protease RseP (regulator of RpoE activity)
MAEKLGVKVDLSAWIPLLERYRVHSLPHETVLAGRLRPELAPESPEVLAALQAWPAQAHLHATDDGTEVVLVYRLGEKPSPRLLLHALLLLGTLVTTLGAGALMTGVDPFRTRVLELGGAALPYPTALEPALLLRGAPFALSFLGVMLCHEMGHWLAARRHGVDASLPYFLPFPPYFSLIGSLGAFIRLRGVTVRRSALLDIGAAGPLASFFASIPLLIVGLRWSRTVPGFGSLATPYLVRFAGESVWLGNGLATHVLASLFGPGPVGESIILLHPVALAGWIGLFVTALNLLPLGQLDGGHVLYSLFPRTHERFARLFLLSLLPLGLLWWGWWAWAVLVLVLHRGRVGHPRVLQPEPGLGLWRTAVGWFLIATFLLTFVPVPIEL